MVKNHAIQISSPNIQEPCVTLTQKVCSLMFCAILSVSYIRATDLVNQ